MSAREDLSDKGVFVAESGRRSHRIGGADPSFLTDDNLQVAPEFSEEATFYGQDGRPCADGPGAVAKRLKEGVVVRFFVKAATSGMDNGRLFDPASPTNSPTDLTSRRSRFDFVKATSEVFETYLEYLQTRKPRIFRNAERMHLG